MTYTPTYTANDVSAIVIDAVGQFGVAIIGFIALVALVILYAWFKGKLHF
jgi:hypothetical protein